MVSVSTDDALLDVERIHRWLSEDAYWARGRSREAVERSLRHSVNVGAYDDGELVGFLRLVTDRATFAWVCDVYVDPATRGLGVGKLLMAEADQRDLLPRIAVPTLLVWGEHDARSPLTVARELERAIPDAELVVIPGCGHVSNLEEPERFNEVVRDFVRAHEPEPSRDPAD